MKRLLYIALSVCTLCISAQAQDFSRLGERTIMGTARYVGMSGAMSAIGADPSAVVDNVAGLGLYRRHEVMLTFDYMADKTVQPGYPNIAGRSYLAMLPQVSLVLCFPTNNVSGILCHNILFSYQRQHTFNRAMMGSASNSPSLGALFATSTANMQIPYCTDRINADDQLMLYESGYVNAYSFDWAMNLSNRWYIGAGLRLHSFSMVSQGEYQEWFKHYSPDGKEYFNYSQTKVLFDGAGVSLALGAIYRPVQWFRLGVGLETPSVGSFHISTSGAFQAQTDTLGWAPDAPHLRSEATDFHMPLHLSTSAAFQVTKYALFALQYDYFHQPGEIDRHSLRAGVEVVPYAGLYLNAGYACESPFRQTYPAVAMDETLDRQDTYFQRIRRTQYVSGAIGYRGRHILIQAAYQYRLQHVNVWAHENITEPYELNAHTHRVVVTIGWHR